MKTIAYYFMVAIEAIAILSAIGLPFTYPVIFADCWPMLLCVVLGIPLLTILCLAIEWRNSSLAEGKYDTEAQRLLMPMALPKPQRKPVSSVTEEKKTNPAEEPEAEKELTLEEKWSHAMYQRYHESWDELFKHMKRPLSQEAKGQISVMLWDIASQTMNFLKESNADLNRVGYNADGVRMILENLSLDDIEQEEFHVDPSTVKVGAIVVYEWLKEQGAETDTTAFGYYLKFK